MVKFKFINGKERKFKKVKMRDLINYQKDMQDALVKAKDQEESILIIGEMVSNFIEPFEAEELFDAEQDEFMIAQALHILVPYYKGGRNSAEIEAVKREIIDASTQANLDQIRMGMFQG